MKELEGKGWFGGLDKNFPIWELSGEALGAQVRVRSLDDNVGCWGRNIVTFSKQPLPVVLQVIQCSERQSQGGGWEGQGADALPTLLPIRCGEKK